MSGRDDLLRNLHVAETSLIGRIIRGLHAQNGALMKGLEEIGASNRGSMIQPVLRAREVLRSLGAAERQSSECRVTVATYEHQSGVDTRVFSSPELAMHWKTWLAETRWAEKLPDVARPSREAMGEEYFQLVEGEFFESQLCNVERTADFTVADDDSPHP